MVSHRIARRYAKSLLLLAKERNELDEIYADVNRMSEIADENRELRAIFRSPIIRKDKKLKIFNEIFGNQINPVWKGFIEIITKNNRENLLTEIGQAFADLYHEEKNILQAVITTAVPIDGTLNKTVKDLIAQAGEFSEVEFTENIDPKIIGGMILRVGDQQIDASVKRQLRNIEKELVKEHHKVKM